MSADLYWQRPASLPSLRAALMDFRSVTMTKQRRATMTETANPCPHLNEDRCILIRAVVESPTPAVSAPRAPPVKRDAVIYSLAGV